MCVCVCVCVWVALTTLRICANDALGRYTYEIDWLEKSKFKVVETIFQNETTRYLQDRHGSRTLWCACASFLPHRRRHFQFVLFLNCVMILWLHSRRLVCGDCQRLVHVLRRTELYCADVLLFLVVSHRNVRCGLYHGLCEFRERLLLPFAAACCRASGGGHRACMVVLVCRSFRKESRTRLASTPKSSQTTSTANAALRAESPGLLFLHLLEWVAAVAAAQISLC